MDQESLQCVCCHQYNFMDYLELIPLFAKIDAHIRPSNSQVGAAAVEAQVPHLKQFGLGVKKKES